MKRTSLNPSRLPMGTQVGGYRVESRLGQGSMGVVYRARHLGTGEECALKVLASVHPSASIHPSARGRHHSAGREVARFHREARLAASISSPEVVRVLAAGTDTDSGLHWIAMEYVEGISLSHWLERRSPSREARFQALYSVFSAVAAAHRRGIVHRDLKPENVLIGEDPGGRPRIKVLDFGIAKSCRARTQITSPGLGSPLWTAPEQAVSTDAPRPSADVWALGLLTFYVLTERHYWRHTNRTSSFADLAQELLSEPIEPASSRSLEFGIETELPPGFDDWFSRCVNRSARRRFRDAGEALRGLALLPGVNLPLRVSVPPLGAGLLLGAWKGPFRGRVRLAGASLALLLVAVLVVAVWAAQ